MIRKNINGASPDKPIVAPDVATPYPVAPHAAPVTAPVNVAVAVPIPAAPALCAADQIEKEFQ